MPPDKLKLGDFYVTIFLDVSEGDRELCERTVGLLIDFDNELTWNKMKCSMNWLVGRALEILSLLEILILDIVRGRQN